MGKLVVSLDGVVIKEVQITKDKTSLGRRPYNDIVIDNLAVSGEHAVLQMVASDVFIEDLNSTNGTYINGKAVKKQLLQHNDTVEIGKYKIKYLAEEGQDYEKTMIMRPGTPPAAVGGHTGPGGLGSVPVGAPPAAPAPGFAHSMPGGLGTGFGGLGAQSPASIKVLNGAAAGREVALTKVVTTVGKPGVQVASITKRPGGYVFAHVEGAARPLVNGQAVAADPVHLKSGDLIELAGTQMQFVQA
ncbi:FHA domain-containing protein [Aquabacterium olei]|jgi:pSer/pThr/pTyr-binding forkhead associated (FHA) protein|uniref:FHA domain-containing protein n=1 Tax=Aquabacterium olei TaxID=1296669 RepID=A0A2U8FPU9_9BURK|nr:FHA domain-containing protein [Aquabacterium olei]AWI52404.1 FHA domain-containing protein [Aquabacterium olei]